MDIFRYLLCMMFSDRRIYIQMKTGTFERAFSKNTIYRFLYNARINWQHFTVLLAINRDSMYFKSDYSLQTECERYNSRFKSTGQEHMWDTPKSSVTNLNTLAHISLLAVDAAAITAKSGQSYRKLKLIKRTA